MTATILIVDDSEVVIKLVQFQLTDAGHKVITARDGLSGLKLAKKTSPDLIILDVQMPEMDGYEVCRQLRKYQTTRRIPIIMLTSLSNLSNMQTGYEAGADDYLTKPFKPQELQMRVESILRRTSLPNNATSTEPEAQTIAVFSMRGGAGCTSLAVNLAVGLSQMWGTPTALLDLALPSGACDMLLNLHPEYTLSRLVHHEISGLDEDLITAHLTEHASGLKLLAGILDPADSELLTENVVSLVIDHVQKFSRYVVLDTGHDFLPATLAALDAATQIIIPITPDIVSARATKAALKIFDSLGYMRDKTEIIVNWTIPHDGIDKLHMEKFLDHPVSSVIPYTPEYWSKAINLGQPVILGDPTSPLISMLENLVWHYSTEADHSNKGQERTDMWRRVAKRRWKKRADEVEMKLKQE